MLLLSAIISIVQSVIAVEKTTLIDGLYVQDIRKIVLTLHVLNAEK
jgi:hypothetical protein